MMARTPIQWQRDYLSVDVRKFVTDKVARQVVRTHPALAPLSDAEWTDFHQWTTKGKGSTPRMAARLDAAVALVLSHPSMKTNRARGLLFSTICCDDKAAHCCGGDDDDLEVLVVPHQHDAGGCDVVTDISFGWSPDWLSHRPTENLDPDMLLAVAKRCKSQDPNGTAEYSRAIYRTDKHVAEVLDAIFELSHTPTNEHWHGDEKWIRGTYNRCTKTIVAFVCANDIGVETTDIKHRIDCFFDKL
jgi:hypothetical protein